MDHQFQDVSVTITVRVSIGNLPKGIALSEIETALLYDKWNEGRYPFYTEMLQEGIRKQVLAAIADSVDKQMVARHGRRMVKRGNSETSLAYLKAQQAMRPVSVVVLDSIKAAKVETYERQ